MLRQRPPKTKKSKQAKQSPDTTVSPSHASQTGRSTAAMHRPDDPQKPLLGVHAAKEQDEAASLSGRHPSPPPPSPPPSYNTRAAPSQQEGAVEDMDLQNMSRKSQWIILAVASGACAAFNGVFAKLTTTDLTTSFATGIANLIGLDKAEKAVEVAVRAIFFGLNLIFNGVMWALFTKALARGTSTTQVSIINTSSNFMITAILGFMIFSESLPALWWLGAALLVAGNVIIGRREEEEDSDKSSGADGDQERAEIGEGRYSTEVQGLLVGDSVELDADLETQRKREQVEDVPNLDVEEHGSDGEELI